jgi:acyl-coenzyme A synthetase/AMP-(fatty) acid ligase
MNAPQPSLRGVRVSLSALIGGSDSVERWLGDATCKVSLKNVAAQTRLGRQREAVRGKTVLIRTASQLSAALALIELDGLAARMVIAPPDLSEAHLPQVIIDAEIDMIVGDVPPPSGLAVAFTPLLPPQPLPYPTVAEQETAWILFTSGTTGGPKMVAHTLQGLTGAINPGATLDPPIWGTFYDIRRYGGLQMLLRALIGGGSMILSDPEERVGDFLSRLGQGGVTHLSGTPSHWRKALMCPDLALISPRYLRLSGEIADQAVLDSLKARFPGIPVGHAYASTEAGVGFEVDDGLEGFPAHFLDRTGDVRMKVCDGSLRLCSSRTALGYVGPNADTLVDADGFVDSGDLVEQRGERFYFLGRRSGVINVGGLKVHPEEVEAVINQHPSVRMSLVRARRNPITGAIVVADVVADNADQTLSEGIQATCRAVLQPFKVPTAIRFVDALAVTPGGKIERRHA